MSDLLLLMEESIKMNSKIRFLTNDQQYKDMLNQMNTVQRNKVNYIKLKVQTIGVQYKIKMPLNTQK